MFVKMPLRLQSLEECRHRIHSPSAQTTVGVIHEHCDARF